METIRNLARRKLRNGLTLAGIVIGVLALTTMGGLAESINSLIDGGVRFYSDHVTVVARGGFIRTDKVAELQRVPGVVAAFSMIAVAAKPGATGFNLVNPQIMGFAEGYGSYESYKLGYRTGREPRGAGDVALGIDLASEMHARVGDTVTLPIRPANPSNSYVPHTYTVVGIIERTLTAPDTWAIVTFADAQSLLRDQLPPALRGVVDPSSLASALDVFATPGTDLDDLAQKINASVADVQAQPPSEIIAGYRSTAAFFTLITTAAALIALIIGALSIVNTMFMAVAERVREIGLKKAVGAHTRDIVFEYLLEATALSGIGGIVGILLGIGLTALLNEVIGGQSTNLFLITPRLVAVALGFAFVLGCGAGIPPALRAARLDAVQALRSQ